MERPQRDVETATVSSVSLSSPSTTANDAPSSSSLFSASSSSSRSDRHDDKALDVSFISPAEAEASAAPLSSQELQQLHSFSSSTDPSSLTSFASKQRPSFSSSSRRQSSIRSSNTFSRLFNGSKNKNKAAPPLPPPQEPKLKRQTHLEKLSFSDRLSWVLEQAVQPGRPRHVVVRTATPRRILVQRAISDIPSHTVDPIAEDDQQQQPALFTEKTLVWSESDPADPSSLQLVTAPAQEEVTTPFSLTKGTPDADADATAAAAATTQPNESYFSESVDNDQESVYDADNDDEDDNDALPPSISRGAEDNVPRGLENTDEMDFARALTRRLKRSDSRARRPRISLPVNLISSTNMPYLNGPKLEKITSQEQQSSSVASGDETSPTSIRSSTDKSVGSAEPSLTDASSVTSETSPVERNHLTQYFDNSPERPSHSVAQKPLPQEPRVVSEEDFERPAHLEEYALPSGPPPAIPRRAPSHSKREHARLARVRSIRSSSASFTSRLQNGEYEFSHESQVASPAASLQTSPASQQHPFSNELEQLSEVAEEFGGVARQIESAEDSHVMLERGLARYGIEDYMTEVSNPWGA